MTIILDGRAASHAIRTWTAESVKSLKEKHGWTPVLVTVQIGDNPASERYVRNQIKACHDVGISARLEKFPADTEKCEFLKTVASLGRDNEVDGIILQTPFPKGWSVDETVNAVPSSKDVEGVHTENLGHLYLGDNDTPLPCTAWAAMALLEWYGRSSFEGKRCAVVGRSPNVGRAAALMMLHRNATVTVCHTRTSPEQMRETLSGSDIIIVAAGAAGIIKPEELPKHAWIVDVGTNVTPDGKLVGDVAPAPDGAVAAISPVPGGVGPITVSMLLANLLMCATRRRLGVTMRLPDLMELRKRTEA